jgi:hypothetical protein
LARRALRGGQPEYHQNTNENSYARQSGERARPWQSAHIVTLVDFNSNSLSNRSDQSHNNTSKKRWDSQDGWDKAGRLVSNK